MTNGRVRLTPVRILEAIGDGIEDEGSTVPQLAVRLGRKEWEVEAQVRDMLRKKLVVVVPARSAHEKRRYAAATAWERDARPNTPRGSMSGYNDQLLSLWKMSDSIHSRTDPRQLCSFGLRG